MRSRYELQWILITALSVAKNLGSCGSLVIKSREALRFAQGDN